MQITKCAMLLVLSALSWKTASAQFESGTVVVVGYSKNKIVIAADSRITDEGKAYSDRGCKILTLGDKFLFSASGRLSDVTSGVIGWDGDTQASDVFLSATTQPIPPSLKFNLADGMIDEWARDIGNRISRSIRPTELRGLKPYQFYIEGLFAGVGTNGNIEIGHATVIRAGSSRAPFWTVTQKESDPPNFLIVEDNPPILTDKLEYIVLGGNRALAAEFIDEASTDRAKAERAVTLSQAAGWNAEDSDARMAIRIAELVIRYTDRPDLVGGPIDAAEIRRGKTIRWIQRKRICSTD